MGDVPSWKRRAVLRRLENLQRAGVEQLGRVAVGTGAAESASLPNAIGQQTGGPPAVHDDSTPAANPVASHGSAAGDVFAQLRAEVAACTRCAELARRRTQTVFGVGNPAARLCFLGEAPGADEDRLGEPFVGRAGQLLDKILAACKLSRHDVYILNILKCRPPGNRNPTPEEAAACRPFLDRQIEIIQPELICCLGTIAAQNLLETTESIGRLRGRFHRYGDIRVLCTYHPAYLLRNPAAKRHVWDDMKLLMREMGVQLD